MSSRSNILNRIRKGLQQPANRPPPAPPGNLFQPIQPENLLSRFEQEFRNLRGEFHISRDWENAQNWVQLISEQLQFQSIAVSPHPDTIEVSRKISSHVLTGKSEYGKNLSDFDLGISICDSLVARTGSVIITSQSGFGRVLSILPPAHLIVARRSQLLPDLDDAYRLLKIRYPMSWPSMLSIITGPSRTADIEKIIVLGAHGPKKLLVLLLDF